MTFGNGAFLERSKLYCNSVWLWPFPQIKLSIQFCNVQKLLAKGFGGGGEELQRGAKKRSLIDEERAIHEAYQVTIKHDVPSIPTSQAHGGGGGLGPDLFLFTAAKNYGHKLYITKENKVRLGLIVDHF